LRRVHIENAKLGLDFIPKQNLKIASIENFLYLLRTSYISL